MWKMKHNSTVIVAPSDPDPDPDPSSSSSSSSSPSPSPDVLDSDTNVANMEPGAAAEPIPLRAMGEQLAALGYVDLKKFPALAGMTLAEIAGQQKSNPQIAQFMKEQEEQIEAKELRLQLLEERNNKLKELKRQETTGR
jgi:hypothetical protein